MAMTGVALSPDGVRVCHEVRGEGSPALVFVHGWSCDRRYWDQQLRYFGERYQVVAIDLAGHGESGVNRQAWTMSAFGGDVVAVAEQLRLGQMVLIGHSMGGDVIVEAARRLPGRVAGLVWVDAYRTLGGTQWSQEKVQNFLTPFRTDFVTATRNFVRGMFLPSSDSNLVESVVADMAAAPPEVAIDALEHTVTFEPAILTGLRETRAPVVAINPDYRPNDIAALQRFGVRTVLMSGVGHFAMLEDPETFNRLLARTIGEFMGPPVTA
jgi:pimeloyl-ACP methyl ester carboxylesterase